MSRIDGESRLDNCYYEVVEPFPIEVRIGYTESNVHIGRSMAMQTLYTTAVARPGDEIHCLVGGNFFIRAGQPFEFDTRRHEAFEVMLHPAPPDPKLPMDNLAQIDRRFATIPSNYRANSPTQANQTVSVPR